MGAEAAGGDAVEQCGRKKVAGGPCGPRGEGFGPFRAAGPALGHYYNFLELVIISNNYDGLKRPRTGRFGVFFWEFLRWGGAQTGPKTWSIVLCTYRIDMPSTVWDFGPSRRRTNFSGGLLVACCLLPVACLKLFLCKKDFNY